MVTAEIIPTSVSPPTLVLWAQGLPGGVEVGIVPRGLPPGRRTVRLSLPPGAAVEAVWSGDPPSAAGVVREDHIAWSGESDGPYGARLRLPAGRASVHASAVIEGAEGGIATTGELPVGGIVSELAERATLLPNGLLVLTKERLDSSTVAVVVAVRAGSRDEDDTTSGGSHWLEHAHFLGTSRRPSNQAVFGAIEAVGGEINATTSWELTDYFIAVPAEEFRLALDVLADMLLDSTFPEEHFNRERRVVFEELNRRQNTPGALAGDLFYSNVFRIHPARRLIGGTIESVQNIPLATILAYREQRYVAGNMTIGIAGRVRHAEAVAAVEEAFARLPSGAWVHRPVVIEPAPEEAREVRVSLGERQAYLMMGGLAPAATSDDRDAFIVLDAILDHPGRRLASEIRDRRGLATSVGTSYFGLTDTGAWAASAVTTPDKLDEVKTLILAELQRVRDEPVSQQEIDDAVRSIRGSRQIAEERNLGQARRLARDAALGLLEPWEHWLERLDRITPADVQRVARAYLDLDHLTTVVVTF
ncbi:MAG: pitrilysin family protein [Chloroflexota bacterium]|nr:insulinase family protein [Dehalococcoidia bacterium]MDW8254927.1 pitrilysin family protein [Chloroflexota bacterium]